MVERVRELICGRRGFVQENLSGQGCQTCGPGATAGPVKGPVLASTPFLTQRPFLFASGKASSLKTLKIQIYGDTCCGDAL